jgi:hypothetical protein
MRITAKRVDYVNGTHSSAVDAHHALGFAETERVVYFRRALCDV